jgi:hypothetical protein
LRRLLILFVLIVLLGAAYLLNGLTANWHYVIPAEASKVAYVATFDNLTDDWDLYLGRQSAQIEKDFLQLQADDLNKKSWAVSKQFWADVDFSVQASPVDGPINNGYGVIFRFQNKGNASSDDDNYYVFMISSDGYYQIVRSLDGEQKELSNWIPSPVVDQGIGVTNFLRVVAVGDRFQFYINGQLVQLCVPDDPNGVSTYDERNGGCKGTMVDTLEDASIPNGQLGVVIQTLDEPGVIVDFDNVLVVGPTTMDAT